MDHRRSDSVVFSSRTRVFRVLSVDDAEPVSIDRTNGPDRDGATDPDHAAVWLPRSMQDAVDEWAALQPDPKPGRTEALRRLLDKALARAG